MKRLLTVIAAMLLSAATMYAGWNGKNWMSRLDDARMVCKVSIPGTHDAMTAEGFLTTEHTDDYTTHVAGLKEQLCGGLRYFDIRLAFNTDTQGDTLLQTSHRTALIKKTFDDVLNIVKTFLSENPTEFIIMKIQYDGGKMNEAQEGTWCRLMQNSLKENRTLFGEFRPDVTVGELRGKVLLLSRTKYGEPVVGALTGWGDQGTKDYRFDVESESNFSLKNGNTVAQLCVQDYYDTIGDRMPHKLVAVEAMYQKSQQLDDKSPIWILSHTSGFSTPKMNALGYAENAEKSNQKLIELLMLKSDTKPVGIIAMDYACIDKLNQEIGTLGKIKRKVNGRKLTKMVIERNWK